ncbi:MAG: HD domain-containing protein [Actinobacteria bacterium]|nr:HD domain-containing protein [Actinomycetota bacterium]MBU1494693.1 HD domain-containing protein [Actinomycetota bacterium]
MSEFSTIRREDREAAEALLAPAATRSITATRRQDEELDPFRTPFERDRDRILHSKAFRRLKHKTQVFMNPDGDHFVTRLTHTLQVTQIGRAMAVTLGLNEPFTEAICLGHDVGHSPFGHTGEDALTPYVAGEWHHAAQSVRIFEVLEPHNLTDQVLDGIRAHSWKIEPPPQTPEGYLCRFADRIAYLSHDVEDALRAGVITVDELPGREMFGDPGSRWIATMIQAVVEGTHRAGRVAMDEDVLEAMNRIRDFMFERVYLRPEAEGQRRKAVKVIRSLVDHYLEQPSEIPATYRHDEADAITRVIDYVAGMTDRFALREYDRIFRPDGID